MEVLQQFGSGQKKIRTEHQLAVLNVEPGDKVIDMVRAKAST